MAVAKVAPGPQPPLPLHAQQPHPPSPHGFLFPSPHSSPTSHCLASSLWTTCKHLPVTPSPTAASLQMPFSSSPPGPHQPGLLRAPLSHPGPAHLPARGTFPQFSVPLRAWRSSNTNGCHHAGRPCLRMASLSTLFYRGPRNLGCCGGIWGTWGLQGACFRVGGLSHHSQGEFRPTLPAGVGRRASCSAESSWDRPWARDHSIPCLGTGRQDGAAAGDCSKERKQMTQYSLLIIDIFPHVGVEVYSLYQ